MARTDHPLTSGLQLEFSGEIFHWRGPAPYLFVAVPDEPSQQIKAIAHNITYGWGVIPVQVQLGQTIWTTSLFPKQGRYLVPIKKVVQTAEKVTVGDVVTLQLQMG
jgi:hypothetical protein